MLFIDEIIIELQKRAITSLRYDLVTDTGTRMPGLHTLYGVFLLFISKNYTSGESLDKLVTLTEYQKANGLLLIPIFYKVTPSQSSRNSLLKKDFYNLMIQSR